MSESDSISTSAPSQEASPSPQPESSKRRFFRDIDSAGNLEDGMEFHASGVVIGPVPDGAASSSEITVLYMNPYTAKVEKRSRDLATVVLYEFPEVDGVYWRLWDQTRSKLEKLRAEQ